MAAGAKRATPLRINVAMNETTQSAMRSILRSMAVTSSETLIAVIPIT
jgi:hypothetical protein